MILFNFEVEGEQFRCQMPDTNSFTIQSQPRPYPVTFVQEGAPAHKVCQVFSAHPESVAFIDEKVFGLYFAESDLPRERVFKMEASEHHKSLESAMRFVDFLSALEVSRAQRVIVVGGGIVQDVAAFASAIYKRGLRWIFFPTTLLAQSDSCLGGKTSLNYNGVKNQLALFSTPEEIYIHPAFLDTLDEAAIDSGLGEILKLHVLGGEKTFHQYVQRRRKDILPLIKTSLAVKKMVIERDEFETGLRKSMNYGHTLGHVIESLSDYKIPHGVAVAMGILAANQISYQSGHLNVEDRDRVDAACLELIKPRFWDEYRRMSVKNILSLLKNDKKVSQQKLDFVMLRSLGNSFFLKTILDEGLEKKMSQVLDDLGRRTTDVSLP